MILESLIGKEKMLVYTAQLLALAFCHSGLNIRPASGFPHWRDCITSNKSITTLMLWYNNEDDSTCMVKIDI